MTPSQSCGEILAGRSGLEELRTLTQKTVADATNLAAKDLSSHCYRARPGIMGLSETDDGREA